LAAKSRHHRPGGQFYLGARGQYYFGADTWAIGRSNWLFAGSLRGGQRAAAIMSLIQSARLNGHDPYGYLKDVLTRLPTQKNHLIGELLPQRWQPAA